MSNFKSERYGCKSIVNTCTLDWNKPKKIKTEFPNDEETNIKNYFLKQYNG